MGRFKTKEERFAKQKKETVIRVEVRHGTSWLPTRLESGKWTWLTEVTRYYALQAGQWRKKATISREAFNNRASQTGS